MTYTVSILDWVAGEISLHILGMYTVYVVTGLCVPPVCMSRAVPQESSGKHPKGPKMGKEPGA